MKDFGLYVIITNPTLSCREIAEICVRRGVKMLQLRDKLADDKLLLQQAREIMNVVRGTDTKFIMNDRVDIAILADADGVHLGQDDISICDARKLMGKDKIIGLSTHSLQQAREALINRPDYIGFGPIYPTVTKAIPDPVVGTELLANVLQIADVPVVAIGGIDESNVEQVLGAGAKSLSAVRYLMGYKDLEKRIEYLQNLIR